MKREIRGNEQMDILGKYSANKMDIFPVKSPTQDIHHGAAGRVVSHMNTS